MRYSVNFIEHPNHEKIARSLFGTDSYDKAKSDPETFYQLQEASDLDFIYMGIKCLSTINYTKQESFISAIKASIRNIEEAIHSEQLDRAYIVESAHFTGKKLLFSRFACQDMLILLEKKGINVGKLVEPV